MSEVYIRSQNKEKLYRLGGNYASVEYGEYEDIKKKRGGAEADKKRHVICISDGCLEEIGEYATKERCLEVLGEIQKACVSYLFTAGGAAVIKVNYGTSGKPERTLLGRTVVLCDYVASYSAALAKDTIFAFLFNFKDYVLNTNYSMGVKKYEDNDTDDQITKGIMLVDGKVVDKNSLVVVPRS